MVVEEVVAQPQAPVVEVAKTDVPATPAVKSQGKPEPAKAWLAQAEDDPKTNEILAKHDSMSPVLRGYLEYEGKKDRLIEIPAADAPDDEKVQFRAKLGVPAKPEDYQLKVPELPKDLKMGWDKAAEAEFRKLAHKVGLSNAQAEELLAFDTNRAVGAVQARNAAIKAAQEASANQDKATASELQKTWGPKFQENTTLAVSAMEKASEPDFIKLMEEAVLPSGMKFKDHPLTAKFFFGLSGAIGEGNFIPGGVAAIPKARRGYLNLTPEQVKNL